MTGTTTYLTYPKYEDVECEVGKEYLAVTDWDLENILTGADKILKTYVWVTDKISGELVWGEKK